MKILCLDMQSNRLKFDAWKTRLENKTVIYKLRVRFYLIKIENPEIN